MSDEPHLEVSTPVFAMSFVTCMARVLVTTS